METSHKLSKNLWQAEDFSQIGGAGKHFNNPLHNETTKTENLFDKKKTIKIQK